MSHVSHHNVSHSTTFTEVKHVAIAAGYNGSTELMVSFTSSGTTCVDLVSAGEVVLAGKGASVFFQILKGDGTALADNGIKIMDHMCSVGYDSSNGKDRDVRYRTQNCQELQKLTVKSVSSPANLNGKLLHKVRVTGLTPGTLYKYSIGQGTSPKVGSFKTLPASFKGINIAVVADMGLGRKRVKGPTDTSADVDRFSNALSTGTQTIAEQVLASMVAARDANQFDLVLDAGDMSYADGQDAVWDSYKELNTIAGGGSDSRKVQWMIAAGNHEQMNQDCFRPYELRFAMPASSSDGPPLDAQFQLQGRFTSSPLTWECEYQEGALSTYNYGNSFYTFTAGRARVWVLNTYAIGYKKEFSKKAFDALSDATAKTALENQARTEAKLQPQYLWLKSQMDARGATPVLRAQHPWWIVMMHNSFYQTNADHQGEAEGERGGWMKDIYEPLFIDNKVAVVLSGHVHAYERSYPVANGVKGAAGDPPGPVYIVIGNGGRDDLKEPYIDTDDCKINYLRENEKFEFRDNFGAKVDAIPAAGTDPKQDEVKGKNLCETDRKAWSANRAAGLYGWGLLQIPDTGDEATWTLNIVSGATISPVPTTAFSASKPRRAAATTPQSSELGRVELKALDATVGTAEALAKLTLDQGVKIKNPWKAVTPVTPVKLLAERRLTLRRSRHLKHSMHQRRSQRHQRHHRHSQRHQWHKRR